MALNPDEEPIAGDIGFSRIGGFTGWWVRLGQWLNGDGGTWPWWDKNEYTHVFIYVGVNQVMEAMPSGARFSALSAKEPPVTFARMPDLTMDNRQAILRECTRVEGVPYSFLDYLSLGLLRLGVRWDWLRNRIRKSNHMICSQLVDEVYRRAGVHIFDDGRLPQDVTPGDLARRLL